MLTLPLLFATARAEDGRTPVLVSSLQAQNPEAAGLAGIIEAVLARELGATPDIAAITVDDAPAFDEYAARTYMDACPPGEIVGCTLVLGSRANATLAVTGTVLALPTGARVQISILDVAGARVMLSFKSDLAPGKDADFAAGVAAVLVAAAHGDIGGLDDIRDEAEDVEERPSNDEIAAQLAELSDELGEISEVLDQPREEIKAPALTAEDLEKQAKREGIKAWERLGLTQEQYLRYRNSGLDLPTWRKRATGRAMQLHLRAFGGYWLGPTDATYYNRYAYDASLVVEDSYTARAVRNASGVSGGLEVAFGLTPFLDLGAAGGLALGRLTVDISSVESPTSPVVLEQTVAWLGPRVAVTFLPTSAVRPTVGGGVTFVNVPAPGGTVQVPEQAYAFPATWLVYGQAFAGAEVRLDDRVDLFARFPVDVKIAGSTLAEHQDTTNAAPEVADAAAAGPEHGAPLGFSAVVGVQVRLFGRRPPEIEREF
ncbi:MAG: hypothetical protein ACOZNI_18555 [Myxococcota bacterium]